MVMLLKRRLLYLLWCDFKRVQQYKSIVHDPQVVNDEKVLVAKLLHDPFDLFLPHNLDFKVLFFRVDDPLSVDSEDRCPFLPL